MEILVEILAFIQLPQHGLPPPFETSYSFLPGPRGFSGKKDVLYILQHICWTLENFSYTLCHLK